MGLGITPNFEEGTCSVCKKKKKIRKVLDPEAKKSFQICQECTEKGEMTISEGMKKYGKVIKPNKE